MKKNYLLIALLIYSIFTLATLVSWHTKGINTITGDEPHYLVMSSGIVKYGSFEQTAPYQDEFKNREIYKHGLAPEGAQPAPENTLAVLGPNGLFSLHNIGLSLLLALPFMFGGVFGAKLFMVFMSSIVVVYAWKISQCFSESKSKRFWVTIATTASLPLIPASNQIYPDLLAGIIALMGLYWLMTANMRRGVVIEGLMAATIVFLPWLQIKFAATCVILIISISAKIYIECKDIKRIIRILMIAAFSCVMLAIYNYYAFGKITGPYHSGALEVSKTSLMVLLGLHIDQNQGFLLQSPIHLIGMLAIGWLYKFNRAFTLIWILVFLSLIVPNGLHPHWYGGASISGRFQWAAAIVFVVPTIFGLLSLAKCKGSLFQAIIIGGLVLQLYFFYEYVIVGSNLYNKSGATWFESYTIFYYPLHKWLPMLYDSSWAFSYAPNYSWMLLILVFVLVGFLGNVSTSGQVELKSKAPFIFGIILFWIFLAGFSNNQTRERVVFQASRLPSQTGMPVDLHRIAKPNLDKAGFINFGPYLPLRKGSYEVVFSYKSSTSASTEIGWVDVFNATSGMQVIKIPVNGTSGSTSQVKIEFTLTHWAPNLFEFRTYWNDVSDLELQDISVRKN